MITISNKNIEVQINRLGAELEKVIMFGENILWERNNEWKSQSPILFPICGRLFENTYLYNGKRYGMNRHGFARNSEFNIEEKGTDFVKLSLVSNEEILKMYPFNFKLLVTYRLFHNSLEATFEVVNLSSNCLYARNSRNLYCNPYHYIGRR